MKTPSILIVDDEPDNFDVIETLLSKENYQLHYAANGEDALSVLNLLQPDLILLDVMMPGIDGIELCKQIKAMPQWESVPIIMVTALMNKTDLARCLTAGADDFISKPVSSLELGARVRSMLRIRQQYQQLATFNVKLEETVQQRTAQLQTMIYEDALTRLPTRTFLLQQLDKLIQAKNFSFAVIYLDCDQFKLVNGSFGYRVGNQLLCTIAEQLKHCLRPGDVLARMGEDEFCFLLYQVDDAIALEPFIEAILRSFDASFTVANCEIFMTACMGIALGSNIYQKPEEPLQDADTAMYKAKLRGKGCYKVFGHQMSVAMLNRLTLQNDLQRALEQQEFTIYYQPIVTLQTEQICGFEALVRWQHPERGLVSPTDFIPCMEETGLIVPVGMVILRQACEQLFAWHQLGWTELTMSVNLSVRQFACPTLLADIDRILAETHVNPARLKLEITESAIMENPQMAIALTEQLRSRHILISIDDFGTGYSSLSYLHRFPVDTLKIDRSFVSHMQPDNRNYQIVNTIIALSAQLELNVIAEGIETKLQIELLQKLGCEFGQGYLFSKPVAPSEIERIYLGDPMKLNDRPEDKT
jgi:diguanylate cyclase